MRLMPKPEREAMFAIYAFCRAVDDIADDGIGTRAERHDALTAWRNDLDALYEGGAAPRTGFLAKAIDAYGLRLEDFLTVIDGMDMDVAEDIRAPSLATLDLYCERVASAVGRLSIKVFGMDGGARLCAGPSSRPRAAAHQYPARHRRGRTHRQALSAAGISERCRHRDHGSVRGDFRSRHRPRVPQGGESRA
jgi:phytoene/squalene synthetase